MHKYINHSEVKYELIYQLDGKNFHVQQYYPDNADPQWVLDHIIGIIQDTWLESNRNGKPYIEFTPSLKILQFLQFIENSKSCLLFVLRKSKKYVWDIIDRKTTPDVLVFIDSDTVVQFNTISTIKFRYNK